ncbi:ribonuclease H-like domain-containing protein [Roridomyces roridus]|uniref:DNA polymerase delta catalytic subunit n=1 Tax=Roridomyces roridus TaxID=1738132 RepID=A0AAD7FUF4_9AGAR|nr:ribonuclease H-like domain-containing protein [Roridomyces roridus]
MNTTALKRSERPSPESTDDAHAQPTKRSKPLGPSQSFADVLQEIPVNKSSLSGPRRPGRVKLEMRIPFQLIDVHVHPNALAASDVALLFGVTQNGSRVLVHVLVSTLPNPCQDAVQSLLLHYKIPAMSWIESPAGRYDKVRVSQRVSHSARELVVKHEDIVFHPPGGINKMAPLKILSFDIETAVHDDGKFTDFSKSAKLAVLQIGNIIEKIVGTGKRETFRIIFTLNTCAPIEGAEVRSYQDEASMLAAWRLFVIQSDPDILTGFNIGLFDLNYLLLRAEGLGIPEFACLGRLKGVDAVARKLARPNEWRRYCDAPVLPGRLQLDTRQYFVEVEQHKLRQEANNPYLIIKSGLQDVCLRFLESRKEDVPHTTINALQAGTPEDRKKLAVY